jgi:hypothetical protein
MREKPVGNRVEAPPALTDGERTSTSSITAFQFGEANTI